MTRNNHETPNRGPEGGLPDLCDISGPEDILRLAPVLRGNGPLGLDGLCWVLRQIEVAGASRGQVAALCGVAEPVVQRFAEGGYGRRSEVPLGLIDGLSRIWTETILHSFDIGSDRVTSLDMALRFGVRLLDVTGLFTAHRVPAHIAGNIRQSCEIGDHAVASKPCGDEPQ